MLTSEAAGLIINTAKGLLKIQRRVDQVLAEKEATEAPLAIPLPDIRRTPTLPQMRSALEKLLEDTKDDDPDPLDPDRDDIRDAVENDASRLFELMGRHLPEQALGPVISLNSEFVRALHPDWASDPDLRVAAFFVGAGRDFREKSYTWRLALTVRGKDYEYTGELGEFAKQFHYASRGTGGMTHNDPDDRPLDVFGGQVTLHTGPGHESYLLVPVIPAAD